MAHARTLAAILFSLCFLGYATSPPLRANERPNVLFIAVDDLNAWVGHLNVKREAKTPHIDALAAQGVSFSRANCAAPACNPSRAALMSGLRPSTTGIYDNGQPWQPIIPVEQTLTTQFLNAGYDVFGAGKIYHGSVHRQREWSDYFRPSGGGRLRPDPSAKDNGVGGIAFSPLASGDEEMPDYKAVSYAIEKLKAKHERPFFLAVGLTKPHMPWSVPKKYFDMFPLARVELPPHREEDLDDVPVEGVRMAAPQGDHAGILASGRWREAVQAYLAAIRFCDVQVGRLMAALDASPHRDNTIVVLWGDHGWHLGEKEHWRKFALWEEAVRTVLIWRAPGVTPAGAVCARPVDLLSVYPTLCDLAGIALPAHVEGPSLRPLLGDPSAPWDRPALTTYHRHNHSLRDDKWRYIRYAQGGEELYDLDADPHGWTNLADDPQFAAVKERLATFLPAVNADDAPRRNEP